MEPQHSLAKAQHLDFHSDDSRHTLVEDIRSSACLHKHKCADYCYRHTVSINDRGVATGGTWSATAAPSLVAPEQCSPKFC